MPSRRVLLLSVIAWLSVASVGAAPRAQAGTSRFVPWKDASTLPLALKDPAGAPHALADYRGKVVLVNFWATWCDPCREEMPSMQRLKERLSDRRLAILAVNYGESQERVAEFQQRVPLDLQMLLDPGQETARAWKVRILPMSFLLDAEGRVRYSVIGEIDWESPEAVNTVRRLLRSTTGAR
jgi:thiol-disulfide isomerase/thioredoxin